MATPSDATWYPLSAEVNGGTDTADRISPFKNIILQLTTSNGFGSNVMTATTGASAASFSTAATSIQNAGNDGAIDTSVAAASSVATAARSAAPTTMTIPGVATQLGAVKAIYDGFGTPYSAVSSCLRRLKLHKLVCPHTGHTCWDADGRRLVHTFHHEEQAHDELLRSCGNAALCRL